MYAMQGAGLHNLGNTCYLNSVLQCLTYTEPFVAYLQSGKHKSSCKFAATCNQRIDTLHGMDGVARRSPSSETAFVIALEHSVFSDKMFHGAQNLMVRWLSIENLLFH